MPKLTSNTYDVKTKTLYLKGDEAPTGYKGKNVAKKEAKKKDDDKE